MDRSHLLQGLRTGGPTRPSPFGAQPLSANPNMSRFQNGLYDDGQSVDSFQQQVNFANMSHGPTIQQQQHQLAMLQAQAQMAALMAGQGGAPTREAQALQMQMEMLRLQALQQQQKNLQAQLMLQNQIAAANQQQQQNRRRSEQHLQSLPSPAVASPLTPSGLDAMAAQTTRMTAANQLRARAIGREASAINNLPNTVLEEQPQQDSPPPSAPTHIASNRAVSTPLNPNAAAFVGRFKPELALAIASSNTRSISESATPSTPTYGSTTVISGGTSLGSAHPPSTPVATPTTSSAAATPSTSYNGLSGYNSSPIVSAGPTKSDSAMSWRRGSAASTPTTSGFNKPPSPPLRQRSTSPPVEQNASALPAGLGRLSISSTNNSSIDAPGTPLSALRVRPSPLRFGKAANGDEAAVSSPIFVSSARARSQSPSTLSTEGSKDGHEVEADTRSNHSGSDSSPTSSTPPSSASSEESSQKKEREEASKRLYEGLGLGRPVPSPNAKQTTFNVHAASFSLPTRAATMPAPMRQEMQVQPAPHRQPIGPPSSVDELGPRNFASRLRKKALGGLGVLMDARDRREGCSVEISAF